MLKQCNKCKKSFPSNVIYFQKDKALKSKLRGICKKCANKATRLRVKLHPWYNTAISLHNRCSNKRHLTYKYYGGRGIKNFLTCKDLKFLWFRDKAYRMKQPSIDRIDSEGHYTLKNCRYIEMQENQRRQRRRKLNRVQVVQIKALIEKGICQNVIAKKFNISPTYVCRINADRW